MWLAISPQILVMQSIMPLRVFAKYTDIYMISTIFITVPSVEFNLVIFGEAISQRSLRLFDLLWSITVSSTTLVDTRRSVPLHWLLALLLTEVFLSQIKRAASRVFLIDAPHSCVSVNILIVTQNDALYLTPFWLDNDKGLPSNVHLRACWFNLWIGAWNLWGILLIFGVLGKSDNVLLRIFWSLSSVWNLSLSSSNCDLLMDFLD